MLPDPLDSALPAIVRRAAAHVVTDAIDPRLLRDSVWPIAERPDVVALDYDKARRGGR